MQGQHADNRKTPDRAVLIMDDDEDVLLLVAYALNKAGFAAEFASDGQMAADLYRQRQSAGQPYHAVILDLNIPGGMGGKEAIAKLREIDPEVVAIASSGCHYDPVIVDYRSYGFTGAIVKPVTVRELTAYLSDRLYDGSPL